MRRFSYRLLMNPVVIGSAILLAIFFLIILILILFLTRTKSDMSTPATAMLIVIPAYTPTITPDLPKLEDKIPTAQISDPVDDDEIGIGTIVQIEGTGKDGLRLRANPSLKSLIRFLVYESEKLQVQDGPEFEDGFTWWYLVSVNNEAIQGWAVSNYLVLFQNP